MVRTFLLLTFLAASAASGKDNAATRIAAVEVRVGGRIGVAALDTGNSKRIDYRPEERFPMCSTFKFLAAAAVLKRVDDKGLTNFVRTLSDNMTRLDRKEPELNSAIPGDERDTTTPAAICSDMQRLLLDDALSEASRHQLEDWPRRNETGGSMIRAGVPSNWIVGDKTGRGANGATNDIAIIRPPDRAPILLAMYSVGSTANANDRAAAIAEVAKIVAESL